MSHLAQARFPVLAAALALAGCGDPFDDDGYDGDPTCNTFTEVFDGQWRISGSGSRSGCSDESLNVADFTLSSAPIVVEQTGGTLVLGAGASGGFDLSGEVRGRCLDFTTRETFDGQTITYTWTGEIEGNTARGGFTGEGPRGCRSEGTFTIRRQ